MKKLIFIFLSLIVTLDIFAQDCTQYIYMRKGKTIETTMYNGKGEVMAKTISFIFDVSTTAGTTTASVIAEHFDKNGKSGGKKNITYSCNGGALTFDMNANGGGNVKFKSGALSYTGTMSIGQHFDDTNFQMEMTMGDKTMESNGKITDRQVVAKESVTTPAGTWECFKITYKTTTTVTGMAMPPMTMETTEWFAPNFGIVQSRLGAAVSKITGIR